MPAYSSTNDIARNHVPGRGPFPSRCIFIGEAPGQRESALRMPFVGQSGQELERYCRTAGIDLAGVYITNLAKYWPPVDFRGNQLPPTPADIARDEPELLAELALCDPEVIVAIGAHAARYFLPKFSNMRTEHGLPQLTRIEVLGREVPVVAVLHPAAGLHSGLQEEMARIQWDFQQVGKLLRGHLPLARADEYPHPQYVRLYDATDGARVLAEELAGHTELSIDTEGTVLDPECVTVTARPGQGWMIEAGQVETLAALNSHINAPHAICTLIFHYLTHDIPVCEALGVHVELRRAVNTDGSPAFRDTMNELHLFGGIEPKGLKTAEWRLCAMEADSFEDVTKESAYETSRAYLEQAFSAAACPTCYGTGKVSPKYRTVNPECTLCAGSGRVASVTYCECRFAPEAECAEEEEGTCTELRPAQPDCPICLGVGEVATGRTKFCSCTKLKDTCLDCVDGLSIPAPARELDFDATTGEFRWKQPQSMAKWIKRRMLSPDMLSRTAEQDEEDEQVSPITGPDAEGDDELSAGVAPYFAIRKAWRDLPPERRALVERIAGKMPRVALRDVKDQARVTRYATRDSDATMRVAHKLTPRLREHGLERAAQIDIAILPILARMERNGMMIDRQHFESFHSDLQRRLGEERAKLASLVGEHNPNSKRMIGVLFRDLQLPTIKLTAGGQESTDDETLGILKAQLKARQVAGHDAELVRTGIQVIDCIQTYREYQNTDGKVLNLLTHADANDRVHTTLNYAQSVSRLSSSDPALQQIPNPDNSPYPDDGVRNAGLRMRRGFIARPGYKIIEADYSAIEMVVGAHLTQDRNLMRIFREGLDPHRYAASQFLGLPMADVPKPVRTQFKCFHPDTEVLTKVGWKRILDLSIGEEIIQAIPAEDYKVTLEWAAPTEVFAATHPSGKLVHLKNQSIDLRVTPDHRMLGWTKVGGGECKVVMPDELPSLKGWANGGELADRTDQFDPPEQLLRLAVAAQADGCCGKAGALRFGFAKPRKIARLFALLVGIPHSISHYTRVTGYKFTQFHIKRAQAEPILGLLDRKKLPWNWLALSPRSRRIVLDEVQYWDASSNSSVKATWKSVEYFSSLKQNVDVLQAIACITNRKTRLGKSRAAYRLTIQDHNWSICGPLRPGRGGIAPVTFDYTGQVACLSVPSTFVLVRDGASPTPVIVGQTLNFAAFYDTSALTIQRQFGLMQPPIDKTAEECEALIAWYFNSFCPDVLAWKDRVRRDAQADGVVRTMFGRMRWMPGLRSTIKRVKSAAERECTNFPIQGTARDILCIGMARLWEDTFPALWAAGIDAQPIMTVHDAVAVEAPAEHAELVGWMVAETMRTAVELSVPVKVSVGIGDNWAEAH